MDSGSKYKVVVLLKLQEKLRSLGLMFWASSCGGTCLARQPLGVRTITTTRSEFHCARP